LGRREVVPLRPPFAAPKPEEQRLSALAPFSEPDIATGSAIDVSDNVNAVKLFTPEGSAEGCADSTCLPAAQVGADSESKRQLTPEERWAGAVDFVRAQSPRHGKSLSFARFVGLSEDTLRLAFPKEASFHRATVFGASRVLIEKQLSTHWGQNVRLVEAAAESLVGTNLSIAETEASQRLVRENDIESKVRAHPATRAILESLGGAIEHIQVLEVTRPEATAEPLPRDEDN
jgi:hypothetical protein